MIYEIPSLCIPFSPEYFDSSDVSLMFVELFGPCLRRIDEINKINYKIFFIHFNPIETNENIQLFFDKMYKDNEVRVKHSSKWFWKINLSKNSKIVYQMIDDPDYILWKIDLNPDFYDYKYSIIEEESCKKINTYLDVFKIETDKSRCIIN
uniref:Uncharacterized protein n=1 Tax=viral metagenome TaxID=1070528 RepID=A0A6C0EUB8_9ZZZZ